MSTPSLSVAAAPATAPSTPLVLAMAAGGALGSLALAQWGWHGVAWLAVVCAGGSLLLRLK